MKFPYGETNFKKIRTQGYFYVDKTRYIEILENLSESHLIILRSRRFGKTLFANMLERYYDQREADQFETLFKGTYIYDHPTPKRNAYMMLTFNFSGINTQSLENANEGFTSKVRKKVEVFMSRYQQHFTQDDMNSIVSEEKPNGILNNLFTRLLQKGLEQCVYVIIDEYDHFANNILSQGKEMFKDLVKTDGYVRPFYEMLKEGTERVVDRLFITGVLPILLDSLTSGFNIGMNLSTDVRFNEMFGFTENEITPILDYLGSEEHRDRIRTYYNGYRFSPQAEQTVYNSDMILFYGLKYNPSQNSIESMIDPNVVSDYSKIRAILSIGNKEQEEAVLTRIVEDKLVSINEITQLFILTRETEFLFNEEALVSLLFYMGYLTIVGKQGLSILLSMPNLVLESLYLDYMAYMLMKRGEVQVGSREKLDMLQDLVDGKIDGLIRLTEKLLQGLSNRDYQQFDEKYIKVVMLSFLSNVNVYIPRSEYEVSAEGYVDVYLQPVFEPEQSASYFIELKYVKAGAKKQTLIQKEREGRQELRKYLSSDAAKAIPHLQAYLLIFRKDRCVKKIKCSS